MSPSFPWSPGAATMPLPESDGEWSETESTDDDLFRDISSYESQGFYGISPISKCYGKSNSVSHSQALADRLKTLDLKAHEYTIAGTLNNNNDKKANHEFKLVYLEKNRFNAEEAAALEEKFQQKVRYIFESRRAEEARRAQMEREERERQARAAAEAARRAAEEKARQEELQRRQREQEELERRRRQEELARAQAEKQRADEEKRRQEEVQKEAELKRQQEEKAAKDRAAQAAVDQENAVKQQQEQQQQQQKQPQPQKYTGPQIYGRKSTSAESTAVSKVLTSLKKVRQDVSNEPQFMKSKNLMAIRRELRPKLGQLNGEKTQTVAVREFFRQTFMDLLQDKNGPTVPASDFFFNPNPGSEVPIPIAFVWTVNELAKLLVKQVEAECSIKPETADPIGITCIATFAGDGLIINGNSFIDIIIARLLKKNPILRGELGPEDTEQDRKRLGWKVDDEGKWEAEETHINSLVGLTAGYAAIAGRDFGGSKMINPYPIFNLWHAVASLLNQPMNLLTNSHFFVMKTLLQVGAKKLVGVYGHQAKKLVELCITEWAIKGVDLGFGGAQAVKAYGKFLREEDWWKNT